MTIIEFLEARIAEDEVRARGADAWHTVDCGVGLGYWALPDCQCDGPARVLAECAAKRAIIKQHEIDLSIREPHCDTCAEWWNCVLGEGPPMVKYPCPTIKALAAVYKDHPDYQQEWAA